MGGGGERVERGLAISSPNSNSHCLTPIMNYE